MNKQLFHVKLCGGGFYCVLANTSAQAIKKAKSGIGLMFTHERRECNTATPETKWHIKSVKEDKKTIKEFQNDLNALLAVKKSMRWESASLLTDAVDEIRFQLRDYKRSLLEKIKDYERDVAFAKKSEAAWRKRNAKKKGKKK